MSSPEPLFSLFTPEEQQTLEKLELQRKVLRRKPVLWTLVSIVFVMVIALMAGVHELTAYKDAAWPIVVVLIVTLVFFGAVAWLTFAFPDRDVMSMKYKRLVLRRLVPKVLPGWVSSTTHRLKNADIRKSGLFQDKANRIAREDYLFGPAGKVVAEVYQIALQTESSETRMGRKTGLLPVEVPENHFYGFFYRVHCPVIFPCDVWVFPRHRKIEGEVDDWAEITEEKYAHSSRKKVTTGDAEFDEHFSVYTNNTHRFAEILTPKRRKDLLQVDRLFATACAFSYTGNKAYAMIGYADDPLDIVMKQEIGEGLLRDHAEELGRMKDVALLVTSI